MAHFVVVFKTKRRHLLADPSVLYLGPGKTQPNVHTLRKGGEWGGGWGLVSQATIPEACLGVALPTSRVCGPTGAPYPRGRMFPGASGTETRQPLHLGHRSLVSEQCPREPGDGGTAAAVWFQCRLSHPLGLGRGSRPPVLASVPESRARLLAFPGHAQWPLAGRGAGGPAVQARQGSASRGRPAGRDPGLHGNREPAGRRWRAVPAGFGGCRLSPRLVVLPSEFRDSCSSPSLKPKTPCTVGPLGSRGSSISPEPQVAASFPARPGRSPRKQEFCVADSTCLGACSGRARNVITDECRELLKKRGKDEPTLFPYFLEEWLSH